MRVQLPNNWSPRDYQYPAWEYLESGGRHAELVWHRRSGKDDISLNYTAVAAVERVATYWHMLPLATQARKAIWDAINPHTGIRRIDEAFPREIRASTREQEMMIRFKNGSTWQVVGSDNFNSMVGAPPAGIVYSEWALSNPAARAYLRPIIAENNGWQVFITTPRGKNHAYNTYQSALKTPGAFAQILTARDTSVFSAETLKAERQAYVDEFGLDMGRALFEQEYLCSFDAAILGAIYGAEIARAREEGRIRPVPYDPALEVHAVLDLGWSDDTAIWFFQVKGSEVRFIDCYANHGLPIEHYHDLMKSKPYRYGEWLWLPHDAKAKSLQTGRSIEEQFRSMGWSPRIVPQLSLMDGIQASRKTFPATFFDETQCFDGLEALGSYRRMWDEKNRCFKDTPLHDWTSHYADAYRYACLVWREEMKTKAKPEPERDAWGRRLTDEDSWKSA